MREALASDFREIMGTALIEAVTPQHGEPTPPTTVEDWPPWSRWLELMQDADALVPVAPESAGELLSLTVLAGLAGIRALGSSARAVQVAGSKTRTATLLGRAGIPVVDTRPLGSEAGIPSSSGWVVKPDDGAGAEGTRRFFEPVLEASFAGGSPAVDALSGGESSRGSLLVVQPFIEGPCGSLFLHSAPGRSPRLLANSTQHVQWSNNEACLVGLGVNEPLLSSAFARELALLINRALPGLRGFWGVDFVCGLDGPRVLEVNPRVTSTYPALSRSLGWNPARLLVDADVPEETDTPGRPIHLTFG
jgi:tyramine---L-glutamate ligase